MKRYLEVECDAMRGMPRGKQEEFLRERLVLAGFDMGARVHSAVSDDMKRLRFSQEILTPTRFSMEKQILIICCTTECMRREARRLLADGWKHYEHTPCRCYVQRPGELAFLTVQGNVDKVARARFFDEIRVCGNAEPTPRQADMLRQRLKNPSAWCGYFPKIS